MNEQEFCQLRYRVDIQTADDWQPVARFRYLENALKRANRAMDLGESARIFDLESDCEIWKVVL